MPTLFLCGAGNSEAVRLAITVNNTLRRWDRMVILDDNPATHGRTHLGVPVAGPIDELRHADRDSEAANLVAKTTSGLWSVGKKIDQCGVARATLVHPGVDLFGTELAEGVTVYQNAIVGAESRLARGSVVFMGAIAGNRSEVGECSVLAPNAVLNARVKLGYRVYIGTNASVLPDINIGDDATIGAGTAVIDHVPAGASVIGVPGQVLRREPSAPEQIDADPGELIETVAAVWRRVLGKVSIGERENFFDAGGTSLKAFQVVAELSREVRAPISIGDFFRFPTVSSLAQHLAAAGGSASPAAPTGRGDLRRQLRMAAGMRS
jgi:acetyltransferase-like isoleucine patch superfamily enzyme